MDFFHQTAQSLGGSNLQAANITSSVEHVGKNSVIVKQRLAEGKRF
jgi:hypothetical protein